MYETLTRLVIRPELNNSATVSGSCFSFRRGTRDDHYG